jgi:amino acid permease
MKNTTLSWDMILKMVSNMFSHDEGYEDYTQSVTKQEFYGNDGVCLFKYFVNKDDPQKEFVWTILVLNLICFLFISVSYILIGLVSRDSSRNLTTSQNKSQIDHRNRKMNRRITIIITTDFCCWIPFIVICALHYFEVLDATPWYSIFSMTVLPINSVINPLLYDDLILRMMKTPFNSIYTYLLGSATYQSFLTYLNTAHP